MEKKLRLIDGLVPAPVDAPQDEIPVSREDGPLQGDLIADLPVVPRRQLPAGDKALPVGEEGLLLRVAEDEFRVDGHIGPRLHAEVRKEILLVDVDAAEPVAPGDELHPFDLPDLFGVGDREGEDDRDRVSRDEAGGRSGLDAGVPGADHRPEQAEGQNGHGDAQDREPAAQLVVKGIPKEDFELEHRSGILCPEAS